MTLGAKGTIFVGTRTAGNVYAVVDANGDHKADRVVTIASGLNMPNGVAFRDGALYVAEINRVLRFDGIEDALDKPPAPVVVNDTLPTDRHHGWKFIAFGPDGMALRPGRRAVQHLRPQRRATDATRRILRMKPDGTGVEVFARGVRNTVGFDWHPATKQLWFTDNGRDNLGDDQPGDELNHAPTAGLALRLPVLPRRHDRRSGVRREAAVRRVHAAGERARPARRRARHALLHRDDVPAGVPRSSIFIAEHGSWNRHDAASATA